MTAPDSEFPYPDLAEAVTRSIAKRADEIIRAADCGEPPVAVLIPDLRDLIHEGHYWRMAERQIGTMLAPHFEKVGRKPVGLVGVPSGAYYRRITNSNA